MLSKPSAPSSLARASGRERYATRMKREIKELKVLNTLLMNRLLTYNDEAVINLTSASSQRPVGEEGSPDDDHNEEPDDEGDDDDDPDDEPSNPEDGITSPVGFKLLINFKDVDHLFILDHSERTVEELKFAVMARLTGVSCKSVLQERRVRVGLSKSVLQKCQVRVFYKCVK